VPLSDAPVRPLSRRETLGLLSAVGVAVLAGCGGDAGVDATRTPTAAPSATATIAPSATATRAATATATDAPSATPTDAPSATPTEAPTASPSEVPTATPTPGSLSCVVKPAQTEGPFFVDEKLNRADVTSDTDEPFVTDALPMRLRVAVYGVDGQTCTPLQGAQVDIWHTSAEGVYSDIASGSIQSKDTRGETYLRGFQRADAEGIVTFLTIFPGWYVGRTTHIHFTVRLYDAAGDQTYAFTSQMYFDDAVSDAVFATAPYDTRGTRRVRNPNDGIYDAALRLDLARASDGTYDATFSIGLELG
jgi:protocatechuate 3,4-dioxygenase beta subunit